jgi:hypothetical protein
MIIQRFQCIRHSFPASSILVYIQVFNDDDPINDDRFRISFIASYSVY